MRLTLVFLFTSLGLLITPAAATAGQTTDLSVRGKLFFEGNGSLIVFLVDEKTFKKPLTGLQRLVIRPTASERSRGQVGFRFDGISSGTYAIRCFQDENSNGKLDRGLFGPSEPWGMSFRGERPLGRPRFKQISFAVERDIRNLKITVK